MEGQQSILYNKIKADILAFIFHSFFLYTYWFFLSPLSNDGQATICSLLLPSWPASGLVLYVPLFAGFLLALIFNLEDGGNMFLQNISGLDRTITRLH
jgi:hypothetical protein